MMVCNLSQSLTIVIIRDMMLPRLLSGEVKLTIWRMFID